MDRSTFEKTIEQLERGIGTLRIEVGALKAGIRDAADRQAARIIPPIPGDARCGDVCVHVRKSADATAIPGAQLLIRRGSSTGELVAYIAADASGNYCFRIDAAGTFWVQASAPGFILATSTIAATCTSNNLTISLNVPQATFPVWVKGCGDNLADAVVNWTSADYDADATGHAFPVLGANGTRTMTVSADGYATQTRSVTIAGGSHGTETFNLLRDSVPVLRIYATHPNCIPSPDPLAGTNIELDGYGLFVTNSSGYVDFNDVPAGVYHVQLSRVGYRFLDDDIAVTGTCTSPNTRTYSLTKRYIDFVKIGPFGTCNGCPREGTSIDLTRTSGTYAEDDGWHTGGVTDATGYATIPQVAEGYYNIEASGDDFVMSLRQVVIGGAPHRFRPDSACGFEFLPATYPLTAADPGRFCTQLCDEHPPATVTLTVGSAASYGPTFHHGHDLRGLTASATMMPGSSMVGGALSAVTWEAIVFFPDPTYPPDGYRVRLSATIALSSGCGTNGGVNPVGLTGGCKVEFPSGLFQGSFDSMAGLCGTPTAYSSSVDMGISE